MLKVQHVYNVVGNADSDSGSDSESESEKVDSPGKLAKVLSVLVLCASEIIQTCKFYFCISEWIMGYLLPSAF